jgi:hypothetical protein
MDKKPIKLLVDKIARAGVEPAASSLMTGALPAELPD